LTICREWSLVNHEPQLSTAICLRCRSWTCEHCRPERRSQLMAQAAAGHPQRFITLTANPNSPGTPEEHLRMLSHAWHTIAKRLRRKTPKKRIEYFVVVEATKRGEPHLHILFRGPFVPYRDLSRWMGELTGAPVVDIRKIKSQTEVVRYLAKYIGKNPEQFGTAKRYWQTPGYQLDRLTDEDGLAPRKRQWDVVQLAVSAIPALWSFYRYTGIKVADDRVTGIPPPYEGEYAI